MKDRIKKYIEFKGISPGELSSLLGVQRSNVSHILNGRNKPGATFIEKMLRAFPDLNARWLFTGEGTMTTKGNEESTPEKPFMENEKTTPSLFDSTEKIQPGRKEDANGMSMVNEQANRLQQEKQSSPVSSPDSNFGDDNIERIILFFRDGTFVTYRKR